MSKYDQLCEAYSNNMRDFKNYKQECYHFAQHFREAVLEYYQVPPERLRLRSKEDPKKLTDDIYEAMDMQKDTFWHIRFAISLQCQKEVFPDENITFEACVKKTHESFLIKLPKETEFTIRKSEDGKYNFSEFLDFLFMFLKGFYDNELERFLTSGHLPKEQAPIGFRFDPVERG